MDDISTSHILVPELPEALVDACISNIYCQQGQEVNCGDVLFDVETDKVVLEVTADISGVITDIQVAIGDFVNAEQIAMIIATQANEICETPMAVPLGRSESNKSEQNMYNSTQNLQENQESNKRCILGLLCIGIAGILAIVLIYMG